MKSCFKVKNEEEIPSGHPSNIADGQLKNISPMARAGARGKA